MWRCEGPYCFAQKRPRTFASALQRVAAVEASKNPLSRDFRYRSIFDFCNNTRSKAEVARDERHVWFTPRADIASPSRHVRKVPISEVKATLFEHLVSTTNQCRSHFKTKCFRSS